LILFLLTARWLDMRAERATDVDKQSSEKLKEFIKDMKG
jgi:hypothetical protein